MSERTKPSTTALVTAVLCSIAALSAGCAQPAPAAMPLIGDLAPAFTAETTLGKVDFPADYKGHWVILFSHPGDFTPVCTTEFMTFADMHRQFRQLNCHLLGLSLDGKFSHIAWLLRIEEKVKYKHMAKVVVRFPVIADTYGRVARKYGMIHPNADTAMTVRAVFIIDPQSKVRAILYYPASTGRNFQEIKRLLIALQTSDKHKVSTPADWQPGDEVILPPPGSCGQAVERLQGSGKDYRAEDWFLSFKKLPKDQLDLPKEDR